MPRMRSMTRALVVLLVLRVVAAPIAARPDPPTPSAGHPFVFRKCAWPAPRPQRMTSVSILRPSHRGPGRGPKADPISGHPARHPAPLTEGCLSRLVLLCSRDRAAFRLTDSPRF
jgi:hypothetical protein